MASQLKRQEETKGPQNPALKGHERTGKSAEKQESPPHDTDPNNKKKNSWSLGGLWQKPKTGGETAAAGHEDGSGNKQKNLQKIGNYAKSLLKGWTDSLQNQLFVEPQPTSNNTTQDSIGQSKGGRVESNENNEDNGEEENEFDDEEEEEDEDDDEGEEADESEESEGYEEEEGSLEEEEEKEAAAEAKSNKRSEEKRPSIDNFAIDDDESPPIQHSAPSLEEAVEDKKHKEENAEKPKKKKAKKGKGKKKKSKGKKNQGARPKQQSDNLVFEDVYVNKNYAYGSLFTDFHQYYFKGDYLDFESDEFFRATLVNEKTAISNLLFNERRYLNIQDQVFYVTKLETVENYKLAMVLESFPLSRLVRLDKVDKKKRLDISFYTEDGGQNIQREMVYEIRNYHKFLRILNQNLQQVNSSYHILSFNIE